VSLAYARYVRLGLGKTFFLGERRSDRPLREPLHDASRYNAFSI
jgi:hypothetical protein